MPLPLHYRRCTLHYRHRHRCTPSSDKLIHLSFILLRLAVQSYNPIHLSFILLRLRLAVQPSRVQSYNLRKRKALAIAASFRCEV